MDAVQEDRFNYNGYPCVILFMPTGYRCGYVGLPNKSKFYKKKFDSIPVACHCGLSYAESKLHGQNDKDIWWIGFDCGHGCDGYDIDAIKKYYASDKEIMALTASMMQYFSMQNARHPLRTIEYCKDQCKNIVDQIINLDR